jgi:hypothetical protein
MKYLKVEVSKAYVTDLYIEVPDDFKIDRFNVDEIDLNKAADETTSSMDWEEEPNSVESLSYSEVKEEEAKRYRMFKHVPKPEKTVDSETTPAKTGT